MCRERFFSFLSVLCTFRACLSARSFAGTVALLFTAMGWLTISRRLEISWLGRHYCLLQAVICGVRPV